MPEPASRIGSAHIAMIGNHVTHSRTALWLFTAASLTPALLISAAALWGGGWIILSLVSITALVAGLDHLIRHVTAPQDDRDDPAATALLVVLALSHLGTLGLCIVAIGGPDLGPLGKIGLIASAGLYLGQVGNSNAHELIHTGRRALHRLGMWVYIALLFGHHTSAHMLVHHRHVATRADPCTARLNEGYYRYVLRAWPGAFTAGYHAERHRLDRIGRTRWRTPYVVYIMGAMMMISCAILLGGLTGLLGYLWIVTLAQSQLLLSDYVQHYGLVRATTATGKPEPISAKHSWNAPKWYSSAMMLNAPRHSDHHTHPTRSFPALTMPADAPTLPYSLPVMAVIALVPNLWRRVMNPRVAAL